MFIRSERLVEHDLADLTAQIGLRQLRDGEMVIGDPATPVRG
jgi:hypothetical protein